MASDWGLDLWDRQTEVDNRVQRSIENLDRFLKFTKEKASIETEYAKNMLKLVDKYSIKKHPKTPDSANHSTFSADEAYQKVLDNNRAISLQHQELGEMLHSEIVLSAKPKDFKTRQQKTNIECKNMVSNLCSLRRKLEVSEKEFKKTCENCENLRTRWQAKDHDSNATKADVEKAKLNYEKKAQEVERKKQDYANQLKNYNEEQFRLNNDFLPKYLKMYQTLDEELIKVLLAGLKKGVLMEKDKIRLGGVISSCLDGANQYVDSANINSDQQKFSELNRSGFPRPQHEKDRHFNDYSDGIGHSVEAINRKYQASVRRNDQFVERYPNSKYNSLPPAQRKRRISADLGNCQTNIEKKEKEVGGVNMLYENYSKNKNLGDPAIVKPQLERAGKELEQLKHHKIELETMFQVVCSQLENLTNISEPNSSMNSPGSTQAVYESPPRSTKNIGNAEVRKSSSPKVGKTGIGGFFNNKGMTHSNGGSSSSLQHNSDSKQKNQYSAINQGPAPPPPPPPTVESIPKPSTRKIGYDFAGAPEDGTVSVFEGDMVEIVVKDEGDGWTEVKRSNGDSGFVPTAYIL